MKILIWSLAVAGVCGCGTYEDRPVTPPELEHVRANVLASGERGLCLGLTDGTVKCLNTQTNALSEVLAPMGASFIQGSIFYGTNYCVLREDGTMFCHQGQWSRTGMVSVARISAGIIYVTRTGEVMCSTDDLGADVAFPLAGAGARQLAITDHEVCAILSDATVRCWPYTLKSEPGAIHDTCIPGEGVTVAGLSGVTQLAMAVTYDVRLTDPIARTTRCALVGDQVQCWGYNGQGMTGTGATALEVATPAPVLGLTGAVQMDVMGAQACAVTKDGSVYCWGPDPVKGDVQLRKMPLTHIKHVSLGSGSQAGLRADGVVVLWGGTHRIGIDIPFNPL